MNELQAKLKEACALSRKNLGKKIGFFLPGMFRQNGRKGRYPAVSITGAECELNCDHCGGKILKTMIAAPSPQSLVARCRKLAEKGNLGVLISGGCIKDGTIPWRDFLTAVETVKTQTDLFISVHCGLVDGSTAKDLKLAGVDQALIDVIGDDQSFQSVYHVPFGAERIIVAMGALEKAALPMVPHIVCGIDNGKIRGEYKAIEMVSQFEISHLVVVSLMPIPGTPMASARPPSAEEVADIIAESRFKMPHVPISLGCARKRGDVRLEELALDAGVNRMALPSDEVRIRAQAYGLKIQFQPTCCSVPMILGDKDFHE